MCLSRCNSVQESLPAEGWESLSIGVRHESETGSLVIVVQRIDYPPRCGEEIHFSLVLQL